MQIFSMSRRDRSVSRSRNGYHRVAAEEMGDDVLSANPNTPIAPHEEENEHDRASPFDKSKGKKQSVWWIIGSLFFAAALIALLTIWLVKHNKKAGLDTPTGRVWEKATNEWCNYIELLNERRGCEGLTSLHPIVDEYRQLANGEDMLKFAVQFADIMEHERGKKCALHTMKYGAVRKETVNAQIAHTALSENMKEAVSNYMWTLVSLSVATRDQDLAKMNAARQRVFEDAAQLASLSSLAPAPLTLSVDASIRSLSTPSLSTHPLPFLALRSATQGGEWFLKKRGDKKCEDGANAFLDSLTMENREGINDSDAFRKYWEGQKKSLDDWNECFGKREKGYEGDPKCIEVSKICQDSINMEDLGQQIILNGGNMKIAFDALRKCYSQNGLNMLYCD